MKRTAWLLAGLMVFTSGNRLTAQNGNPPRWAGDPRNPRQHADPGPGNFRQGPPQGHFRPNPYPVGYLVSPFAPVVMVPGMPWSYPPPVLFQPSPIVLITVRTAPAGADLERNFLRALLLQPEANARQALPAPAFGPMRPDNREQARGARGGQPRAPERRPAKADRIDFDGKDRKRVEPPPFPDMAAPPAEPAKERERLIEAGREAFQIREYARAERRFGEAARGGPDPAQSYFLLAEAQFALGKYQEAVASIRSGLDLRPAWPWASFHPRQLFGLNQADHAQSIQQLADALARYPDDPDLLFLYAYHLWFDDRREEARPLLVRAAALAGDAGLSQRFLQPVPYLPFFTW